MTPGLGYVLIEHFVFQASRLDQDWTGRSVEVVEMMSQRRGAQLGLISAAMVLVASFGILIVQGRTADSDSAPTPLSTSIQNQPSVPMAVSLSARTHSQDSGGQQ
jgi:hypothetical protein